MATLMIRNLDEQTKSQLRQQAARHGHSMEEEARRILRQAVSPAAASEGLGTRLQRRFGALGGLEPNTVPLPDRALPDFQP
jgi:plasmid stability protein